MHPEQSKKTIIKIVNNLIKLIEQNILDGEEIIIHNFVKLVKVEKPVKQAIIQQQVKLLKFLLLM